MSVVVVSSLRCELSREFLDISMLFLGCSSRESESVVAVATVVVLLLEFVRELTELVKVVSDEAVSETSEDEVGGEGRLSLT